MKEELALREELIWVCGQIERKGLIAATDGNVSCRVGSDRLLITPSGTPKGALKPEDLLLARLDGEKLGGSGKPSSELRMHLLVYRMRGDVQAIVHAHPPMLTAFTLAGIPFASDALPEVWLTMGRVPTAPYATPTTVEVPEAIAPWVGGHQAILMERHGSLTFGADLKQAYFRLEKLEHAAHTLFYAHLLKGCIAAPLSTDALNKLDQLAPGQKNR